MNIYKATVTQHIVVSGENFTDAMEAVDKHTFIDGVPRVVESLEQIHSVAELEHGWTGNALAFSKCKRIPNNFNQQSIAYWLKQKQ